MEFEFDLLEQFQDDPHFETRPTKSISIGAMKLEGGLGDSRKAPSWELEPGQYQQIYEAALCGDLDKARTA